MNNNQCHNLYKMINDNKLCLTTSFFIVFFSFKKRIKLNVKVNDITFKIKWPESMLTDIGEWV